MSNKRRQGTTSKIGDPLIISLGDRLDECADELGVIGCTKCPVQRECKQLWEEIENWVARLTLREFRQYSQKFYMLKEKRDQVLAKRVRSA